MTRSNKILLVGRRARRRRRRVLLPRPRAQARGGRQARHATSPPSRPRSPRRSQTLATYEDGAKTYKTNYATLARLGKAVPADDDVRSLIVQLEATAERSGVDFQQIELGDTSAAPTAGRRERRRPPAGELARPRARSRSPAARCPRCRSASASPAAYFDLSTFFARLEHFVHAQQPAARRRPAACCGSRASRSRRRRSVPGHAGRDQRRDLPRPAGRGRRRPARRAERGPARHRHAGTTPPTTTATATEPPDERPDHHLAPARAPPLWPVAVLLLAALVAVPVLLAREPAVPETIAPAGREHARPTTARRADRGQGHRRRTAAVAAACSASARTRSSRRRSRSPRRSKPDTRRDARQTTPADAPVTPAAARRRRRRPAEAPRRSTRPARSIVRFGDATTSSLTRFASPKLGPVPDDESRCSSTWA